MKKIALILLTIAVTLSICSCSSSENNAEMKKSLNMFANTWYEDGMFYEAKNSDNEAVLCYYSKDRDMSVVMCGLPECTHRSKESPDCVALADSDAPTREGFNRIGDKLYFIAIKPWMEEPGSLDLIECDINGRNRRVVASVENTAMPFINNIQYTDDHVIISYYQIFDMIKNEHTGQYDFVQLDKYRFFIKRIEMSTGKIETLVTREEYEGYGSGVVYDNVLYYNYRYSKVPPTGEALTTETAPKRYGGFYIRDLESGEEKEYEDMSAYGVAYAYFSPDRIIAQKGSSNQLYRLNIETGESVCVSDNYALGCYGEDETNAYFGQEDGKMAIYNFESGEKTQVPVPDDIHISQIHILGNTVWLDVSDAEGNNARQSYIDKDDFAAGKFENIKEIKKMELQ